MKIELTFLFLLFGFGSIYGQNNRDVIVTSEAYQTNSTISYHAEIPATSTYKIIKNTTGTVVSDKVLEEINLHRRFDVDYLWVVNENIHILVYYFNKPTPLIETSVD